MHQVHVFKVGPFENGRSFYVPMGINRETRTPLDLDPVESDEDVAALRQLIAQTKNETLVCSIELADAAKALDLAVEEIPLDYEGTRVQIAMNYAQGGALGKITHLRSHLRLMSAIHDFLRADVASRWPVRQSFDVELRGDRSERLAGFLTTSPSPTLTLVRSENDAKDLALSDAAERTARLAKIDHLSMSLVAPPAYALAPIESLYNVNVMPAFEKIADGQKALANDEDALVMAGVLKSLAMLESIHEVGHSTVETPGRTVRTFVSAGLPFPFVELP